jgi:hypothetical protein
MIPVTIHTDDGKYVKLNDVEWWQFVSPFGNIKGQKGELELIGPDGSKLGVLRGRLADLDHITGTIPERPEAGQRLDGDYIP